MALVNPAALSTEERPIGLHARTDLLIQESVYQGTTCWIVKDPLAMKYYRLQKAEYLVFQKLHGDASYLELKELLDRQFPETVTRLEVIQQLVVSMHRNGLLKSGSVGQAYPLRKQRNKELKQKAIGLLSSLVSIRFPGFDPEGLLSFLYPRVRWFFTYWFTAVVTLVCLAAALLVVGNLEQFYARLPDFQSFFAFDNLLFMGVILIFTKTIHEFGHGLMCKHFGGECHEIGFMLLVLTPAMYCNTSDSWVLPNRWHRIAIGAAGMYVEVFMAAICTFIWWFTQPGWVHFLALNIMFLSSVSTILFNANPLLRYDGYYMLSDFLEIPNLAQKSKLALTSKLRVWCLGMKPVNERLLPERNQVAFAIYSVASFVYRWFVMIVIFWFLWKVFEPYGLSVIGFILVGISLIGMIGVPLYKLAKFFWHPGRLREVKRINFVCTVILSAVILGLICYYPLPQYVYGHTKVRPLDAQMVTVTQPGNLRSVKVEPGDQVKKGDVIAVLSNRNTQLELLALQGELAKLESDLIGFEVNRSRNLDSERLIAETKVEIRNVASKIEIKNQQLAPLTLRADRDGVVILPPNVPREPVKSNELRRWSGVPLDPRNVGAFLDRNTLVCMIADPDEFEAIVVIDQSDVQLVKPEQPVKMLLEQSRSRLVSGSVVSVAQDELSTVPRELSQTNGGPVAVKPSADGQETPVLKLFEVYAKFDMAKLKESDVTLASGFYGEAKIHVGQASLGSMTMRYLRNLINFR
ncbi:MAG: HlyD family efflux transporter periplasmic adaptor subunit [Planctomycetota bacterium]